VKEFMARLKVTATAAGRDVDTEAFHFVLLLNTVRTAGAGAQWARDVASHLLRNYLTVGDRVSIVPYQLAVRPEAVWDQAFESVPADRLYRTIPLEPMQPVLGHDTERAVLQAVQRLGSSPNAIYITLSDSEASQRPLDHRWNETMQREWRRLVEGGALREAEKGRITGIALDAQRRPHPATLYYRTYLPGQLEPLATGIKRPTPPLIETGKKQEIVSPRLDGQGVWPLVLGLLGAVAVLGALSYGAYWLLQPRQVTVRYRDDEYHGSVTMGSQTRIGGKDCKGIELPGLDDGAKLLVLTTDALGRVVARGHAPYTIISPKEPVMLSSAHRRLTIKRMDDTLDLEIWRS